MWDPNQGILTNLVSVEDIWLPFPEDLRFQVRGPRIFRSSDSLTAFVFSWNPLYQSMPGDCSTTVALREQPFSVTAVSLWAWGAVLAVWTEWPQMAPLLSCGWWLGWGAPVKLAPRCSALALCSGEAAWISSLGSRSAGSLGQLLSKLLPVSWPIGSASSQNQPFVAVVRCDSSGANFITIYDIS